MSIEPVKLDGCIIHEGAAADARLATLGLEALELQRSVLRGDEKRRQVDQSYYPRNFPGIVMWAETTAELRKILLRKKAGWDIGQHANYETVFSASGGVAVSVVGGDERTGLSQGDLPKLRRKRGPRTKQRVLRNRQLEFDLEGLIPAPRGADQIAIRTWFLLTYPDEDEMRLELALPVDFTPDGIVHRWRERIIVPSVAIQSGVEVEEPYDPEDDDEQLVTRN